MRSNVFKVVMGLLLALVFSLTGCGGGGGGETVIPSGDVSKYAGSYSGTYSGSDSGTWSITTNSAGVVTGSAYSSVYKTTDAISGSIGSGGALNATIGISSDGATFTGTADANGVLSGTWKNTKYNQTGTFTGKTTAVVTPSNTTPTVTAFAIPATSTTLTVSITTLTATDNVAVTGYMVTESSTAPLASATEWTSTKPASFTFSTEGSKTLYAWAKDAGGLVSAGKSAAVVITLPIPPKSLAEIAGTWTVTTPSGKGTFTVGADGKIATINASFSTPNGDCFSAGGGTANNGSIDSSFKLTASYSHSDKSTGFSESSSISGTFISTNSFKGTYSARASVANSFGACSSSGSGSFIAVKQ
jgi:hypothetical protein